MPVLPGERELPLSHHFVIESGAWNFDYCFTNGPAGMLHQEDRRVATPHRFFHEDAVGAVWNITDASGAITDWRNYDAFGNFDDGAGMTGVRARFGGTNGYRADDNGLLLLGHRYYDSKYGRFITQDPIGLAGGDLNLYNYCGGNPLTRTDPMGLMNLSRFRDLYDHYIRGGGTPYHLPIKELNLSAIPVEEFKTMHGYIEAKKPGSYEIDEYRMVAFDPKESLYDAFAIGTFELRIKGTLEIDKYGGWTFSGRATAVQDTFDFQRSTHRPRYAEMLTTFGRNLDMVGAKPFKVLIEGYQNIFWTSLTEDLKVFQKAHPGTRIEF